MYKRSVCGQDPPLIEPLFDMLEKGEKWWKEWFMRQGSCILARRTPDVMYSVDLYCLLLLELGELLELEQARFSSHET